MALRWYVVQTKHNTEALAAVQLRNQGFTVFYPCFKERIVKFRKLTIFTRPLYPSYVFAMFDIKDDLWWSIKNTRGVKRIIGATAENVIALRSGFVEKLIESSDEQGVLEIAKDNFMGEKIKKGDLVRIKTGSFSGLEGRVLKVNKKRISILLPLLSQMIEVSLPLNIVELCPKMNSGGVR